MNACGTIRRAKSTLPNKISQCIPDSTPIGCRLSPWRPRRAEWLEVRQINASWRHAKPEPAARIKINSIRGSARGKPWSGIWVQLGDSVPTAVRGASPFVLCHECLKGIYSHSILKRNFVSSRRSDTPAGAASCVVLPLGCKPDENIDGTEEDSVTGQF
ncbi:hypothetical protein EVAR_61549_1 [Eumeta japonica]|uniref:Uncharacterized protein n=1 Tax=Eumeta variegata TaxID=151549 RepID=A0A4C1ZAG1_EUMVA|nr:hypothetical protein EVAR_61549_1 [Eumeta japonica]